MGLGGYLHGTKFINVNMNNIIPLWPKTIESQMPTRDSHINQSLYHKKHLHPPPPPFFSLFSPLFFSSVITWGSEFIHPHPLYHFKHIGCPLFLPLFRKEQNGGMHTTHILETNFIPPPSFLHLYPYLPYTQNFL